jgi:hypothetical protein
VKLKEKASGIEAELGKVREAILDYARREAAEVIRGSDHKARVKFDKKLKFPGKNEAERPGLEQVINEAGKWQEVSQLDTTALTRVIEDDLWSKELVDQLMKFGRIEESGSIHLLKLKDEL